MNHEHQMNFINTSQYNAKGFISGVVAVVSAVVIYILCALALGDDNAMFGLIPAGFVGFILIGLRVINEYERGIVLTLGRYTGTRGPGLRWICIGIQQMTIVDTRVKVVDVPDQDCITKDNVSLNVNAVLYYSISSAEKSVLQIENFARATSQLAQTTMRDVVGEVTLDSLLTQRDEISAKIQVIVDKASDEWGVKVQSVDLKHVELPNDMKRTIAKEAEAERERRSVIIKAEGEKIAAQNLADAAKMLTQSEGSLHLRTLHALNDISSDKSNTIVFTLPMELLRTFQRITENGTTNKKSKPVDHNTIHNDDNTDIDLGVNS